MDFNHSLPIHSLPSEVLLQIVHYLGTTDLLNVALTCHKFVDVAQEALCKSPVLSLVYARNRSSKVVSLLRTLIEQPVLATRVQSLKILLSFDRELDYRWKQQELHQKIVQTWETLGYSAQTKWNSRLREGWEYSYIGLLLALVPNLVHLDISNDFEWDWEDLLRDPLTRMFGPQTSLKRAIPGLVKIQELNVSDCDLQILEWSFPQLTRVTIRGLCTAVTNIDRFCARQLSPCTSTSRLQELTLRLDVHICDGPFMEWSAVLANLFGALGCDRPNPSRLNIEFENLGSQFRRFKYQILFSSIYTACRSFPYINILHRQPDPCYPVHSIAYFTHLRHLSCPFVALAGNPESPLWSRRIEAFHIKALLPPKLEYLEIDAPCRINKWIGNLLVVRESFPCLNKITIVRREVPTGWSKNDDKNMFGYVQAFKEVGVEVCLLGEWEG